MKLTTIGIDLAKNVLQVHGADENGKAVLKKQLKRAQVLPFFADLTPCENSLAACFRGSLYPSSGDDRPIQIDLKGQASGRTANS